MRLALAVTLAVAVAPRAAATTYVVDAAGSSVTVHVGKAGLFKFAGHEHTVGAPRFTGEIVADAERIEASRVALAFDAGALAVLPAGEPPGDAAKVQERMLGADVLDAARHPRIEVRSLSVSGRASGEKQYDLSLTAEFGLRGVTRRLSVPVHVEVDGARLTATGELRLRQSEFGITPVSVAGVVKVKDELTIEYRIVAHAAEPASRH